MADTRRIKGLGWHAPLPDPHRPRYEQFYPVHAPEALPPSVDLRPHDTPIFDQGQLGCHSEDTEVLTENGWKLFKDLTGEEKLASVDPVTHELIYERPTELFAYDYDGELFYGEHQFLDFAVTPNHKMIVRTWNQSQGTLNENFEFIEMKDVGWYVGLMNSVHYSGNGIGDDITYLKGLPGSKMTRHRVPRPVPTDAWLRFLGIFVAEGTLLNPKRSKSRLPLAAKANALREKVEYKIQIAASKEREKSFIRNVFNDLGIKALELKDRFTFSDKQVWHTLREMGYLGVRAPQKFVPEFVFGMSSERIKEFLKGHFMGDGCLNDSEKDFDSCSSAHYTSSSRLADDLQRLTFLSGSWSTIITRQPRQSVMKDGRKVYGKHPEHRVSRWYNQKLSIDRKANVQTRAYKGKVYCAEVPTYHTLVTRRNNCILISSNSCTGNAIAGAMGFLWKKERKPWPFVASRLFIYYNERAIEGTVGSDSGAAIADGISSIKSQGVCKEDLWPYDINQFAVTPPASAYHNGLRHLAPDSFSLDNTNLNALKTVLAQGWPFVFGFTVYGSFENVGGDGMVPMPGWGDSQVGGHAVMCVGYDDSRNVFIVRNSWGTGWGAQGYCYMPYAYLTSTDLASDFWVSKVIHSR